MSLITAVSQTCNELGINPPTVLFGSADPTYIQLLALATAEAQEFFRMESPWGAHPRLIKEYAFYLNPLAPITGTITGGSTTISSLSSVAGIVAGYGVAGANIPASAVVVSVGASSIVINIPATGTATTTDQTIQISQVSYSMPSDYDYMVPSTQWDRNFRWQMLGPLSPQEQQTILSGISPVGPRLRFWLAGSPLKMRVQPNPGATQVDQIVFDYASNGWCTSASGTAQTAWAADTDVYVFEEYTLSLGIKWRWKMAKGLPYAEERLRWSDAVATDLAREGGSRNLPLNAMSYGQRLLNSNNIPDTGFGA